MDRLEAIGRLCSLQSEVSQHLDHWQNAADCFCQDPHRGGNDPRSSIAHDYRNEGQSIEFIEMAVRQAIADGLALPPKETTP